MSDEFTALAESLFPSMTSEEYAAPVKPMGNVDNRTQEPLPSGTNAEDVVHLARIYDKTDSPERRTVLEAQRQLSKEGPGQPQPQQPAEAEPQSEVVAVSAEEIGGIAEGLGIVPNESTETFTTWCETNNVSKDQAQELMTMFKDSVEDQLGANNETWAEQSYEQFSEEDIGLAQEAFSQYVTDPEVLAIMETTGLASHPAVISFFRSLAGE